MVMPANNSSRIVHKWAAECPGRVGWLVGPTAIKKTKLRASMPFALDNDAYGAFTSGTPWSESAWLTMLKAVKKSRLRPLWCLVPDVVADRIATLAKWKQYAPIARSFGWPLAMAVQNGMTPEDVPPGAVVFVGGSTDWKWQSLPMWCASGHRVHVGRVNSIDKLHVCERLGVESVDGTGWFRDSAGGMKIKRLDAWMRGNSHPHPELF